MLSKSKRDILTITFKVINVKYFVFNDYLDLVSCINPDNKDMSIFSLHLLVKGMLLNQIQDKSGECAYVFF